MLGRSCASSDCISAQVTVHIENTKQTTPQSDSKNTNRDLAKLSHKTASPVQALKALGKEHFNATVIVQLQNILSETERKCKLKSVTNSDTDITVNASVADYGLRKLSISFHYEFCR